MLCDDNSLQARVIVKIQMLGDEYPSLIESLVNIQNKASALEENVTLLKEQLDEAYRNLMETKSMTIDDDRSYDTTCNQ